MPWDTLGLLDIVHYPLHHSGRISWPPNPSGCKDTQCIQCGSVSNVTYQNSWTVQQGHVLWLCHDRSDKEALCYKDPTLRRLPLHRRHPTPTQMKTMPRNMVNTSFKDLLQHSHKMQLSWTNEATGLVFVLKSQQHEAQWWMKSGRGQASGWREWHLTHNKLAPYGTGGRLLLTANFKVMWHKN